MQRSVLSTGPVLGTRHAVAELLEQGIARSQIAAILGVSKATVSSHARGIGKSIDERCARRYDWSAVQEYYDAGHSVRECIAQFGFSSASWNEAHRRGQIDPRPHAALGTGLRSSIALRTAASGPAPAAAT